MFQKQTFGSTNTGFGSFNAGASTSSPFSGFKPATGATSFGAPPAFGANATPQPATGGGLFGSTNTTGGLFGGTTATSTGFGATSGFGFGASPSGGGLFNNSSSGLFGNNQNNSAFGAKPATGNNAAGFGFGATANPSTTGGLFGSTPSTSTGLFGQQNTSIGGGLFGNTTGGFGQQQATGTAVVKYNPVAGTDVVVKAGNSTNVNIKHHCITCMKEYESKSLEELRLDDYVAGRKGPSGVFGFQQAENKPLFGATSTFGQPATTSAPSLFGSSISSTPAFGQTNTFSFGGGTQTNTQTMGLFGANKPAFGATPTPGTGLFAATTTQAPAFGTNTATFGFGANTQNQTGGLFNNKPAATSGFGTTPSTGFGGFGAGLFAKTNTTAPTFGTTTPAFGTTGFGTNTTGSNLFGNNTFGKPPTSQPSFGFNTQPALGTGLGTGLGTSFQPKPTNPGFGTLGTTGSLFQPPAQNTFRTGLDTGLGGGMFNNNSSLGGSLGMGSNNNSSLTGGAPSGVHAQILSLVARPYGDSGLYKDLLPDAPTTSDEVLKPTNPSAVKAVLDSYRVSPATRLKLTVRPVPHKHDKKSLFDGLEESDASLEDKLTLKPSRKRLVLRNKEPETTHDTQRSLEDSQHNGSTDNREEGRDNDCTDRPANSDTNPELTSDRHGSWLGSPKNSWKENEKPIDNESTPRLYPNLDKELPPQVSERRSSWLCSAALRPADTHRDADHTLRELTQRTVSEEVPVQPHPAGVKLTRPGYYTIPSLDEMIGYLRADGSCVLPHFTVGRRNYGNVFYDEEIDVAGLDLDALVHFLNKEVIIYPEDGVKPPVGSGLNRRAVVTLERVWPRDKTERRPVTEPDRLLKMDYEGKLRRVCDKHDTKFIEYRPQTGSWVFRVEHFSKYGLTDSDEEDDITPDVLKRQLVDQALQKSAPPQKPVPVSTSNQPAGPGLGGLGLISTGPGLGGLGHSPSGPGLGGIGLSPSVPSLPGLNMTLGLSSTDLISDDYMQQTSLNLMNGASKGFGMDITDDHIEGDTLYQDGALGVKSPTSELARLEHRQSHHVQLMKASLYADTEMLDDISMSTGDQLVPRATEETVTRVESVLEVIQTTAAEKVPEVSLRPLIVHPHTIVLKYNRKIPPFKKTIAGALSARCPCELSVSRARHSRVSLRPGGLAYVTTGHALRQLPPVNDLSNLCLYVDGRGEDDWSEASVVRLAIGQLESNIALETLSRQLTSLLEFSDTDTTRPVCPRLVVRNSPTDRRNLLLRLLEDAKHAADYKPNFGVSGAYCLQVWRLCDALWGLDLEHDGVPGTDEHSVVSQHKRLIQWLKDAVSETTDKELSQSEISPSIDESDLHSSKVWTLLMGGRVMEACKLSKESGDLNMAAIIAQATGDPSFKSLLCRQLRVWRECGAESLLADARLASLTLVAGLRPRGSFEKCDWLRTLLAVTCYITPQIPSLEQIIRTYESYLTDDEMSVQHPRPPYMDRYDVSVDNRPSPVRDLRYELLSSRASHVRPRLHTNTYTPDPFDCTLRLLINLLLGRRYDFFLLSAWWGAPEAACVRDLANLLEAHGEWHKALHVLMHHPEDNARGHLIREVLNRNAPSKADTPELKERLEFVRALQIPEKWLLMAQAYRAKYEHKPLLEVDHLVAARQWDEAHRVLVDELLPDAVLSDKLSAVCAAVRALGAAAAAHCLRGWGGPGEALQHYSTLCEEIRAVVGGAGPGAGAGVCDRLRALRPSLAAACRALALFEPTTPRQAAARAEMGARLVQLAVAGGEPPPHLAALLRTLRLPPDCAAGAAYKITTDLAEQASELCLDSTPSSPISSHHRTIVNS